MIETKCTVLGQCLFNFYNNDMQKQISHENILVEYADECLIFASFLISNDELNQLQSSLLELANNFCQKSVEFECIKI